MRWSLSIGKLFGINFRIHITFLLLLVFVFIAGVTDYGLSHAAGSVLFICAVFACVLIHEIGHSLVARRFGKGAKSITLLPIGGVAAMEEMPEKPWQEISMAIVGPFINLLIAGILYLLIGKWSGVAIPNIYSGNAREFFAGIIGVNIMLAVFNMIPAFPMDGGRVLRGILATRISYVRATAIAAGIGQAMAMFFIFFGIFFNLWLALIGVFLYIGAGAERQQVVLRSILHEVSAKDAMATDFYSLAPDEPLSRAVEFSHHGYQEDFPVVGYSGLEGVLTRSALLAAIHERGLDVAVSEVMDRNFMYTEPYAMLDEVYKKMVSGGKMAAAVVEGGKVTGMISLDGIGRYFMIQSAMKGINS